jgi:hypothetical protein
MGIINKHGYMTSILFACLAKAALDGEKDYMKEGIELFYKYLKNPKNRVKIDGKLKKFIKDYEKGKAYKYTG